MNILVITRSAWDDSNSTGNTMTNFFKNYDTDKIANLYFREARPNNDVCKNYFSISDKDILKSIINYKKKPGKHFQTTNNELYSNENAQTEEHIYGYFRKKPSTLALWFQERLWDIGTWKNEKLDNFLNNFQPDIIFFPSFSRIYTHKLLWYIQKKTNAKIILFHADDYLSINENDNILITKQKKNVAKIIKRSICKADLNYCISEKQKLEYEHKTGKEMEVLYKGAEFLRTQPIYNIGSQDEPIEIVYVGSILYGRWKTLAMLARKIKEYNIKKQVYKLKIYSQYEPTEEMKSQMIIEGVSEFLGKIAPNKIDDVYKNADIVLHTESFDESEKMKTRLSFSTKIVDCLNSGRAIIAIGWEESASIDYFIKNSAALVATNEAEVSNILRKIQKNPSILKHYADKAWECGKKNHQITSIQKDLYNDLENLLMK